MIEGNEELIGRISASGEIVGTMIAQKGPKGDKGSKGDTGDTGATGNGISSITLTSTVGKVKTYTITFTDGTTTTFQVEDGKSIEFNWSGTQLGIREEGTSEYTYVDLKGAKGDTGNTGNSGVYIGDTEPTDPNINVWIDTSGTGETYVVAIPGKGLSTNDYDNTEKANVASNTSARHTHSNKNVLDNTTASYTTEEKTKLAGLSNYDDTSVRSLIAEKQSINDNSLNTTAKTIVGGINEVNTKANTNASDIDTIEGKIPNQATSSNQLADKDFVNSSIGTNTANYIYKTVGEEKLPFDSVAELEAYSGTVTNNDYAFVKGTDEHGNTYYDRYKATVSGSTVSWAKEYRLNNSSFTANQWASIQSGITALLVAQITTNQNAISGIKDGTNIDSFSDVESALNNKEDNSNKVTSINSSSTNTQYPSAKAVYDYIQSLDAREVSY